MAPRPPGVPDSAVSIGPRLRALAVCLLVFQYLPVGRCGMLLSGVAGAEVSAGFIRSCLAKAASMAAGVVTLTTTLIIASKVTGSGETTLRSGAAGEKKYARGAFTGRYSRFHLGTRSLETMRDFGILPGVAGIAVTGAAATSTPRGRPSPATRPAAGTCCVTCETARKPAPARSGPRRHGKRSAR